MSLFMFKVAQTITTWKYIGVDAPSLEAGQIMALDAVIRPNAPDCYGVRATIEDAWAGGIIDETNNQFANIVHGTNLDGRSEGTIV